MTKIRSENNHQCGRLHWGEPKMRRFFTAGVALLSLFASTAALAEFPSRDSRENDPLDELNFAAGEGGTGFGNGEAVHMFNGNLQVVHASSPTYPVDGGLSFGLSRVYNSNSVVSEYVFNNGDTLRGRSWVGLGWKMHLGRFYSTTVYNPNTSPVYKKKRYFFETSAGTLINVEWVSTDNRYKYRKRPSPAIYAEYFPPCGNQEPDAPVCDDGLAPPCNDNGPAPGSGCGGRPANDPAHYRVTFPDGTAYRMEKIIPYQYTGNGYLKNDDRAGYYTTQITDSADNWIRVSYNRNDPNFPEAITRVWSKARQTPGDMDIQLETCTAGDPATQCPAGTAGVLKRVVATSFRGDRAAPQTIVYEYSYDVFTIPDQVNGTGTPPQITVPMLRSVSVNGFAPGGTSLTAPGGTIGYRYLGDTSGVYTARLLDRIGYPSGAASVLAYGTWVSGQRAGTGILKSSRNKVGVITRTLYPDGDSPLDPDGSGPLSPLASRAAWRWQRDFRRSDPTVGCSDPPDTTGPQIDIRTMRLIGPTGLVKEETWGGNPCGSPYLGWDQLGSVVAQAALPALGANAIRSWTITLNSTNDGTNEEPLRTMWEKVISTFHDDTGTCFGESDATGARKIVVANGSRSADHWSTTETRNSTLASYPGYFPVRDGQDVRYRTERTFDQGTCFTNRNMPHPPVVLKHTEDTGGADQSREVQLTWICSDQPAGADYIRTGLLAKTTTPWEWNSSSAAASVAVETGYDDKRNPLTSTASGSLGYGATGTGNPTPNTYASQFTVDRGVTVNATMLNGSTPYLQTQDLTLDGAAGSGNGAVSAIRDATGIEVKLDYDALGRPTQVLPASPEAATTNVYVGLNEIQSIHGGSSGTTYNPGDTQQQFTKVHLDGLGRPEQVWNAGAGGSLSTQVTRYDDLGRVVFVSEWISDADYASAGKETWAVDRDGTAGDDYRVSGVPLNADGKPWGTTYFYGSTSGNDPLLITPDGLGRLVRVDRAGELQSQTTYCGMHREVLQRADLNADGTAEDVRYRYYHDGLGRLVLVDAPPLADQTGDGTNESADAEYAYNLRGNVTQVKLYARFSPHPFANWKAGASLDADGVADQERTFQFDALGRMTGRSIPEEDPTSNLSQSFDAFDAAGNVLRWQDANGRARDFYFRNTFDPAGRLVRTEKIKGSPASTPPPDDDRLGSGTGTFESGIVGWESGTFDPPYQFKEFTPPDLSYWKAADYAQHPCNVPAGPMPDGAANTKGLWFGKVGVGGPCSYSDAPSGPQVLRKYVSNATRDDVLTFQLWRQVREGNSNLDAFTVYIVQANAATNDMSGRRIAWRMDGGQRSWSRWQRIFDIRPADLFTHAEWPENSTKSFYLLFVFEKSDTVTTGINGGLMVDNIFLGRRGVETLVEMKYDEPLCTSSTPALLSAACEEAGQPTDRSTGRLTTITGFQGGIAVDRRRFVYRGMNGRISGEEHAIDWTGTEFLNSNTGSMRWVSRWGYDNNGIATSIVYPHQPGQDYLRRYIFTLDRGRVTGINEGSESIPFLSDSPAPIFDSTGKLLQLKFTNQTSQSFTYDSSNRLKSITSIGLADNGVGTQELWSTGLYRYDPANNITAIGQQQYQYDEAGRLVRAEVQPQASSHGLATEEVIDFRHDPFGNLVSSTPVAGGPMSTDPVGLAFAHIFATTNRNRIVTDGGSFSFDYDPNGNMQRFRGKLDQTVKAFWSDTNQMTLFYEGDPAVVSSRPGETYLYDASGMRVVRQPVGLAGLPELDLRASDGQTLSRFIHVPGNPNPKLDRDYIYGEGMIERVVTSQPPTGTVLHPMITTAAVNLNVNTGSGTYSGDLTTPAGWTNFLPALTADGSGNLTLAESELKANEVNFLRLKKDGTAESAYSAPVALIVDSGVTTNSPNQVRALAVHRSGNNVTIRWSLLSTNNKSFRLYFRRADNNTTYTLTPQGLPSTTRTLALGAQALSAPCGSFFLTQVEANGSETAGSAQADLPSPNSGAAGRIPCGGGSGGGPPAIYSWLNNFHHRDHLFSLRVLTDESGKRLQGTDFFPYGLELVPDGRTAGALSRAKFTMHDRDEETGTDDMVMRAKAARYPSFLSVDLAEDVSLYRPGSWSKYSYARANPVTFLDPLGLMTASNCEALGGVVIRQGQKQWCALGGDGEPVLIDGIDILQGGHEVLTVLSDPLVDVDYVPPVEDLFGEPSEEPGGYPENSYLSYMAMGRPAGTVTTIDANCFMDEIVSNWLAASGNTWGVLGAVSKTLSGSATGPEAAGHVAGNYLLNVPGGQLADRGFGTTGAIKMSSRIATATMRTGSLGQGVPLALRSLGFRTAGQVTMNFAIRGGVAAVAQELGLFAFSVGYTAYRHDRCIVNWRH